MSLIAIIVLAIVQGLSEFLPVSSSAHLILVPLLTDWPDQSLSFDIAVHLGTLVAVVLYFRRQLLAMAKDYFRHGFSAQQTADSRLAWYVVLGSLPLVIVGFLGKDFIASQLRSAQVIAGATITFGLLLAVAQWKSPNARKDEYQLTWQIVLLIGCAQALALIPGTSRSGITITVAILLGVNAIAAARFSFLLSIPAILGAGTLLLIDVLQDTAGVVWIDLVLGALLSGVSAFICIHFFLQLLSRIGLMPFVIYRLLLGGFLFWQFA